MSIRMDESQKVIGIWPGRSMGDALPGLPKWIMDGESLA